MEEHIGKGKRKFEIEKKGKLKAKKFLKFFISDDDVLYRIKSNTNGQHFPACQGKVLLAKNGGRDKAFYLSLMPISKTKKSYKQGKASPLPITSSAPLEIVGTDFLHLEKPSGGYEYILLNTDHFTRYKQVLLIIILIAIKPLKLVLPTSAMTLSFALVFHLSYYMAQEESLRIPFSNTLQTYWISTICEPPPTNQKQKASLKRKIRQF